MGLNIRVVRLQDVNSSIGFYITEGFESGQKNVKTARIKFCPFCGNELEEFYGANGSVVNSKVENFLSIG